MSHEMVLRAKTKLGPYEIPSLLDVGGMGEVYRARDTHLDRNRAMSAELSHRAQVSVQPVKCFLDHLFARDIVASIVEYSSLVFLGRAQKTKHRFL